MCYNHFKIEFDTIIEEQNYLRKLKEQEHIYSSICKNNELQQVDIVKFYTYFYQFILYYHGIEVPKQKLEFVFNFQGFFSYYV